jgi:hypothetical protein
VKAAKRRRAVKLIRSIIGPEPTTRNTFPVHYNVLHALKTGKVVLVARASGYTYQLHLLNDQIVYGPQRKPQPTPLSISVDEWDDVINLDPAPTNPEVLSWPSTAKTDTIPITN